MSPSCAGAAAVARREFRGIAQRGGAWEARACASPARPGMAAKVRQMRRIRGRAGAARRRTSACGGHRPGGSRWGAGGRAPGGRRRRGRSPAGRRGPAGPAAGRPTLRLSAGAPSRLCSAPAAKRMRPSAATSSRISAAARAKVRNLSRSVTRRGWRVPVQATRRPMCPGGPWRAWVKAGVHKKKKKKKKKKVRPRARPRRPGSRPSHAPRRRCGRAACRMSLLAPCCFISSSWASMHMPQPLMAETARDQSSKSTLSTPGLAKTFIRSRASML